MSDEGSSAEIGYSEMADQQLDTLESNGPAALYNAVLDICESVFADPGTVQARSSAITTTEGIVLRTAVPGFADYKVFWTTEGPRIEAVFPYP